MVAAPSKPQTLETLCINSIRFLSIDAVEKAKSGHPGLPMGAAPMAFVLFDQFLKFNPKSPKWFDRDRFVSLKHIWRLVSTNPITQSSITIHM